VIRQRAVGDGFQEKLTILNHDDRPVELEVRLEVGSDFADLFEVKDALEKKGAYDHRVEDGRLVLAYRREAFSRETRVSASAPAELDQAGIPSPYTSSRTRSGRPISRSSPRRWGWWSERALPIVGRRPVRT
jgi:uncharacterized protein YceH (UPF0502 family)